jgi:hypothetical protein
MIMDIPASLRLVTFIAGISDNVPMPAMLSAGIAVLFFSV